MVSNKPTPAEQLISSEITIKLGRIRAFEKGYGIETRTALYDLSYRQLETLDTILEDLYAAHKRLLSLQHGRMRTHDNP